MKSKNNIKKTVLLGLSGGVDSSVAALLLKEQGYHVIGAFIKNFSDTKNPLTAECSYLEDKKMAQKIAALLNIPLIIGDYEKEYKRQVINPMFKSYAKGLTPNPDMLCNKIIKFPLLWKEAKKYNADYIATGHYAQIKKTPKGSQLLAGKDKTKDQSYFLAELSQKDLSHALFPIGKIKKIQVREIAKEHNFPNADKKGTSGICFVGKVNMKSFLEKRIKHKPGNILDPEGNIIGTHQGVMYYTIGQRVGERIGLHIYPKRKINGKWYIAQKKKPNTLTIAPKNHLILKKQKIKIKIFHLINPKEKIPKNLKARIRHLGPFHKGKLVKKSNACYFVFDKPLEQIAEGQFIVLYHKNQVIASGEMRYSYTSLKTAR